ncbi:MAG TPA: CAP domain-containing protein [Chitinophaga sp.]|uniref:CAP domain-containing protein n=1 Tax=Chitinophaga sp. TaxID=1869181 RepID=UPI002BB1E299|nr:CAP domain-containing protein [Chitinophaga sp.]HVI48290.1 CAP domain-containing protein [Chitinophaga sp.]
MPGKIVWAGLTMLAAIFVVSCTKETTVLPDPIKPGSDSLTVPENHVDRTSLLTLVNGLRSKGCKCGGTTMPPVGPLTWSGLLEKAGYDHSKDMSVKNYFAHDGLDGSTPGARLDAIGYHWNSYGENIAMGNMDEQAVILGWLNSPGHCRNMMNPDFTEIGVGRYDKYWTMELGRRSSMH